MSGPALKAVMLARRVGDPALKAALSLASSAKTHTARRHAKGMICVWVGSVLAAACDTKGAASRSEKRCTIVPLMQVAGQKHGSLQFAAIQS